MQITVKILTGKQIPLTVSNEETVESLNIKFKKKMEYLPMFKDFLCWVKGSKMDDTWPNIKSRKIRLFT